MSWHNKAHFSLSLRAKRGLLGSLPRDLSEDHPEQSQGALEMQAEERAPPSGQRISGQAWDHLQMGERRGRVEGGGCVLGSSKGGSSQMWRQVRTWFGFFQRWHLGILRVWAAPSQNALKGSRLEQRPSEELQGSLLPRASLAVQSIRICLLYRRLPASVGGLGSILQIRDNPLKEAATPFLYFCWKSQGDPEEPGRLHPLGSQRANTI